MECRLISKVGDFVIITSIGLVKLLATSGSLDPKPGSMNAVPFSVALVKG